MKSLLPYLASLCGVVLCSVLISTGHNNTPDNKALETTGFEADSGYITVASLHKTLGIPAGDTLFRMYEDSKPADTLGKYYKMANGNYIASIATKGSYNHETIKICEATKTGKILKAEEYWFGNYRCCWESIDDCFKKQGDYYIFTSCGTGSGFCGGDIYVFKDIKPQRWQESIPKSVWTWAGPDMQDCYISITSKMQIKDDTVYMQYTNELYEQPEGAKTSKTKKTEKFDIAYTLLNGNWAANDSTKLKEILEYR